MGVLSRLKKLRNKSSPTIERIESTTSGEETLPINQDSKEEAKDAAIQVQEVPPPASTKQSKNENEPSNHLTPTKSLIIDDEEAVPPPAVPKDADMSQSAYYTAWSKLEDSERSQLGAQRDMRQLFEALSETDEEHNKGSRLRRGLKIMSPYLERIGFLADLASPFVSLNPTAATAHGLIKGSIAILTAICGAGEDLTGDIESFLQRIPAIERVNEVVKSNEELPDIHEALVTVYKDLFDFIIKVNHAFKRKSFLLTMAITALRPELPGILSSFNKHADALSKLLDAEVFATILQIKDEITNASVGSNLDVEEENLTALRRKLRQRADDACTWIAHTPAFNAWTDPSSQSPVLAMLGDMGCGKTMTTAYIADKGIPADHIVCSYYITGGTHTAEAPVILRSLMWQLMQAKPRMKREFLSWFRDATTPSNIFRHVSFDDKIREFLRRALLASREHVYIVLDALDECDVTTQRELAGLFDELLEKGALVKVFVSMRHNDEAEAMLPEGAVKVEYQTSLEQSRVVAGYLAEQLNIPKVIREKTIEQLSSSAEGSAIWLRLALEYIKKSRIASITGLELAMNELRTSKSLTEMYWKLFEKCKADLDENEDVLAIAFDTLAVAQRPLTVEELAYAVCIPADTQDSDGPATIQELDDLAHSRSFFEIIQPFVHRLQVPGDSDRLRLVHHSLRELILRGSPSEWQHLSKTKPKRGQKPTSRKPELEGYLLQRCITYLLYDECGSARLPFLDDGGFFFELGDVFHDADDEDAFEPASTSDAPAKFDPKGYGFGGFYAYAASYWTHHYAVASDDLQPSSSELVALCGKDAQRKLNWVEQWRRPNCFYTLEGRQMLEANWLQAKIDPLTVAAVYGSRRSVAQILKADMLKEEAFHSDTLEMCIGNLVIHERTEVLGELLADDELRTLFPAEEVLCYIAFGWYQYELGESWDPVLDTLISLTHEYLLKHANAILCGAASHGALPLIKKLFHAASSSPALHTALLSTDIEVGERYRGPLSTHQSIGEAVRTMHPSIVRFLCEQNGISPHLHYTDASGSTVYHKAAPRGFATTAPILLEYWPEGILAPDVHGDDALSLYIHQCTRDDPRMAAFVRHLLKEYGASLESTARNGSAKSLVTIVLAAMVAAGHVATARALIRDGEVTAWDILEVDDGETPRLTSGGNGASSGDLLRDMCYLLPLAVSTAHLFMA